MSDEKIKNSLEWLKNIIIQVPSSSPDFAWTKSRRAGKFQVQNLEKILLKEAGKLTDRGELLWPLRAALSGRKASPGPFEIAAILGKKETLRRLDSAIQKI